MVFAVRDAAKSEALWSQLLALPAMFGAPQAGPPQETSVGGRKATQYQFPNLPPIVLVSLDNDIVIAGSRSAVTTAIAAGAGKPGIKEDQAFASTLAGLTPTSSKAVAVHFGRLFPILAGLARGHEAEEFKMAGQVLSDLTVSAATDETPTRLVLQVQAGGLPQIPEMIRMVTGHRMAAHESRHHGQETTATRPAGASILETAGHTHGSRARRR
jgi:hypothetical protein